MSRGFEPTQSDNKGSAKPEEALKYIGRSSQKAIFVLQDFHPFLEEKIIVRWLRDLVFNLKRSYKSIILVFPTLKIPPELRKDITVFDLPLPDAGALGQILNHLFAPYKNSSEIRVDTSPELREKVIQATLGLTRNEASPENMRQAIALAEAMSPTVLWLDEIEKGFSGTGSSGSVDAGVTARVFATFLTWMQEKTKPVFVIATANNIQDLAPELLRKGRFVEIFFIDLPKEEERKQIFSIHIGPNKGTRPNTIWIFWSRSRKTSAVRKSSSRSSPPCITPSRRTGTSPPRTSRKPLKKPSRWRSRPGKWRKACATGSQSAPAPPHEI